MTAALPTVPGAISGTPTSRHDAYHNRPCRFGSAHVDVPAPHRSRLRHPGHADVSRLGEPTHHGADLDRQVDSRHCPAGPYAHSPQRQFAPRPPQFSPHQRATAPALLRQRLSPIAAPRPPHTSASTAPISPSLAGARHYFTERPAYSRTPQTAPSPNSVTPKRHFLSARNSFDPVIPEADMSVRDSHPRPATRHPASLRNDMTKGT